MLSRYSTRKNRNLRSRSQRSSTQGGGNTLFGCVCACGTLAIVFVIFVVGVALTTYANSRETDNVIVLPPPPPPIVRTGFSQNECLCSDTCFQSQQIIRYTGNFPEAALPCLDLISENGTAAMVVMNDIIECRLFSNTVGCIDNSETRDTDASILFLLYRRSQ